ncbi:GNAT family N-acetyltransferase [Aeromonas salmonicida]|uniref:GNAT family N-acetyltransferase n=1 Tax=Aeromonas salmonicida TaxID=645 RepID=UPI00232FBA5F|nr:GNAT family N-acetyltransferase [Aeromonas salmonicida]WCH20965.1 GNAT family N-acetyltransferase [Aeromonas salmonicida]
MVVIRTCNEQDVAGLLTLYRELRPHDPPLVEAEAALATLLAQSHVRLIVAEVDGQLAATCQQDCYKVMLLSGEGREAAHRLYEKLGFKAGIEKGFVIKQVDAKGTAEPLR